MQLGRGYIHRKLSFQPRRNYLRLYSSMLFVKCPDVVAKPAFFMAVWAEVDDPTLGSEYHNDRIDFVYVRGETGVLNVSWMLPLSVEMHPASI